MVVYVRVFEGTHQRRRADPHDVHGEEFVVSEVGGFRPQMTADRGLSAGEVGYLIAGHQERPETTVGDTVTDWPTTPPPRRCPAIGA